MEKEERDKLFICVRCGHTESLFAPSVCVACGRKETFLEFEESQKGIMVLHRFVCKTCAETINVEMGELQERILLCCRRCFTFFVYYTNEVIDRLSDVVKD